MSLCKNINTIIITYYIIKLCIANIADAFNIIFLFHIFNVKYDLYFFFFSERDCSMYLNKY